MHRPLVLASTSPYRRRLLADSGIAVETRAPDVDERALDHLLDELGPERLAVDLARRKAHSVGDLPDGAVVLAADQLAVLTTPRGITMLTKPDSVDAAISQLMAMAGRTHRLINGLFALDTSDGQELTAIDVHLITMHHYSEAEARAYVERYRPLDSVGAYRIEDDAGLVARSVGSDRSGVIGLPIPVVRDLLRRLGVPTD